MFIKYSAAPHSDITQHVMLYYNRELPVGFTTALTVDAWIMRSTVTK